MNSPISQNSTSNTFPKPKEKLGWYAIYTTPRAEKKVCRRISELDIEAFLPTIQTRKVWSDRIKKVDEVLFPSYVFVHCLPSQLRSLLMVEGTVRVIYFNSQPAVIRDKEIEEIKSFIACAVDGQLELGEQVQILTGGLKLVTGKVKKIGRSHIYLYLEDLGALVCVRKDNVSKTSTKSDKKS